MSTILDTPPARYFRDNVHVGLTTTLARVWPRLMLPLASYSLVAVAVALNSQNIFPVSLPPLWKVLVMPVVLVVFPSLIEEVVFRGVLLPRKVADAPPVSRFAAVSVSTAIFTIWHPLNHWLIGLSDTSIFVEPAFLFIVVALGYACGYAYLRTGSLWAPIFIHWLTTVVWNLFFGR